MATLLNIFTSEEIDMLFAAIEAKEKHCKKQAEAPIKGYGKVSEWERKAEWKIKADSWRDLSSKIAGEID